MEEPEGWRELQQKALDERDPQRLVEIMNQLVGVLAAHEKKLANDSAKKNLRQPAESPDSAA